MIKLVEASPIRNSRALLHPIDLEILPGQIQVIMGPSGVGKSSLIGSIVNEVPYIGSVVSKGKCFQVFQDTNQLFPWMTIHKNLLLANPTASWEKITKRWNLDHLLESGPDQCSVGQKQRLTLLRALYSDRDNLLCDEPLSGVDKDTVDAIIDFFINEVQRTQKAVLWVTHDLHEANKLGNVINVKANETY